MAFSYREVLDRYDRARAFGETRGMSEYAQHLNDIYDTQDFDQGMRDGPWTRFSTRADQYVFEPIAKYTTEPLFGAAGALFGHEDAGRQVGRSLPRMFANMAPLALTGPAGPVLTGLAFGGHTYADTGSAKAATISGVTGALMPAVGRLGGNIAARLTGTGERVVGDVTEAAIARGMPKFLAETLPIAGKETQFKAARFLGQQAANIGMSEGSTYAVQKTLDPSTSFNPLSPEFLIQQIPWTVMDMLHLRRPVGMTSAEGKTVLKPKTGTEAKPLAGPIVPPKERTVEEQMMVGEAMLKLMAVANDPKVSPQEKAARFAAALTAVKAPEKLVEMKKTAIVADPTAVPKIEGTPAAAPVSVVGHAEKLPKGGYRVVVTQYNGAKALPEHKTVFVNGAEPTSIDPNTKEAVFEVRDSQVALATYGKMTPVETRVRGEDEAFADNPPAPVDPQMELQQRAEGVEPTAIVGKKPEIDDPFGDTTLNDADRAALKGVGVEVTETAAQPKPPLEVSPNRLVSDERAAALKASLRKKFGTQLGSMPDPTIVLELAELGVHYVEKGVRTFAAWSQTMVQEIGEVGPEYLKAAWEQMKKTEVGKMLEEGTAERLKATAVAIDQTQSRSAVAAEKIVRVPEKAEDYVELAGETAKPKIEQELAKAASADQAAETARLVKQTPEYADAQAKLVALAREAETIVNGSKKEKAQRAKKEAQRTALQTEVERAAATLDAAHLEYSRITANPITEKGPARDAYELQLSGASHRLVAAGREAQKLANRLAKMGDAPVKAEDLTGGEQNKYGLALKDEEGNRIAFATTAEAENRLLDLPEPENWRVRDAGADRGDKRYYLAPVENLQASLDADQGGGAALKDKFSNELPSEEGDLSALPDLEESIPQDGAPREAVSAELVHGKHTLPRVSEESLYDTLERMESDALVDTSWELGFDGDTVQAKLVLHQAKVYFAQAQGGKLRLPDVNAALEAAGLPQFKTYAEMDGLMLKVLKEVWHQQKSPMTALLGSRIPHDEVLVERTGVRRGAVALVDWLVQQKDMGGLTPDLVAMYKNFPDLLATAEIRLPYEHDAWMPGTFYENRSTGKAVNFDFLPTEATRVKFATDAVHELTHHMESELSQRMDPAAVAYRAEKLRILEQVRANKSLPADVRKVLETSIKENHYIKSTRDEMNLAEHWKDKLGVNKAYEWFDVMYALVHQNEFTAQMMSNRKVQAFMLATQVKGPWGVKSVLNWFSQAFNRLIGGSERTDNALAQMIGAYDNYLTGGLLRHTYNGHDYIRDMLVKVTGVRPEALASRLNTLDRTFAKGDLYASIAGFQREGENALLPTTAKFGQIDQPLRTALVNPEVNARGVYDGVMALLPEQLPHHQELFYRMQQDVEIAKNLYREIKAGNIGGTIPEGAPERLRLAEVKVNAMRRALRKQNLAVERQNLLKNFTYEGLDDTLAEQLQGPRLPNPESEAPEMGQAQELMGLKQYYPRSEAEVREQTSAARLEGKNTLSWYEKNLMFTSFVKKLHAELRPVLSHVQDIAGRAIQTATELNMVLNGRVDPTTGQYHIDKAVQKSMERVAGNAKLKNVFSEAIRLTAERAKAGGPKWSWNDKEFKALLSGLDPQQRQDVQTMQAQFRMRHEHFVNTVIPTEYGAINQASTARVFAALENGMLPETARDLSQQTYDALALMQDSTQLATGQQLLSQLSQTVKPETFVAALKHASQSMADLQGLIDVAQKNPDFVSEKRFKDDRIRMRGPNGENFYSDGTVDQLRRYRAEKEAQGYTLVGYEKASDAKTPSGGVNETVFAKLQEMDSLSVQRITAALSGRPDSALILDVVLPESKKADMLETAMKAFTPVPGMSRKLVGGRENLDMIENAHEFYVRGINWFRHKRTRAETDLDMMHPEIAGNTELKRYSEDHVQNYLTPDNPIVRKLTEAVFYQRMAFNFGNSLLESFQSLTTGMQSLIAETGSVGDAYGFTGSALKEMSQRKATGKWSSPELEWFDRWSASVGLKKLTLWDDIQDPDRAAVQSMNYRLGSPTEKTVGTMKNWARKWSGFFQEWNNSIASIAAFKIGLEREGGRTDNAALLRAAQFARDITVRGTFTGGKAQRSVGLWGIKTKAVPQLMSTLNTYTLGWFSQMATDFKVGFRGAGSDVTPQQRLGSKKAFLYGLAAQAVLAGGLGLPGVGQGIALLNQASGLDLKGWLRQNLSKLFDEDQDSGGLLTNLALRGAASAFSPIDPSNRAAISVPFLGVDPYKGFSIAALAGAPGTSVSDFVQGLMAAASGDVQGVQKLLPSVLKGPAQLSLGEGDVRDARGGLLQTLSPSERFFQALGLSSSRLQQSRDAADALKRQQQQFQRSRETLVDQLATDYRKGDIQHVQQRILELKKQDPTLDVRSLGEAIKQRVLAQTIPYEARRSVNPALDLSGLQTGSPGTESLRRQTGYQVMQGLGFQPRLNPRADFRAQQTDALLNSNPFLTRAAALNATGTRRVARPYTPQWSEESL